MSTYLASVTHDIKSNTLEGVWLEEVTDSTGAVVELRRVRVQNYPADQKDAFAADAGIDVSRYFTMAGW